MEEHHKTVEVQDNPNTYNISKLVASLIHIYLHENYFAIITNTISGILPVLAKMIELTEINSVQWNINIKND